MKKIIILLVIIAVLGIGWYLIGPVFIDNTISESMPNNFSGTEEFRGNFVDADNFHKGSGIAKILSNEDSSILRFEDFMVTNGPALFVTLSKHENPINHDELGDYLSLGELKGNIGDQNYEIPEGTDLSEYKSVVIYCKPFRVIFSIATLK